MIKLLIFTDVDSLWVYLNVIHIDEIVKRFMDLLNQDNTSDKFMCIEDSKTNNRHIIKISTIRRMIFEKVEK